MAEAIPSPRRDDTSRPDELKKVHRTETKTKTVAEAKRQGPTLDQVKADTRVRTYIRSANAQTGAIGYTEHGERHANTSADGARFILKSLGHEARRCEIAAVAAYLHDIGNVVTREKHGQTGALIAKDILEDLGFDVEEIAVIMGAIANHEEAEGGLPVSAVSAAVIIADKSDVHRSSVRNPKTTAFDIDYWFAVPGERVHKFVHFFLMRATGGDVSRHDHEYDHVRWVAIDEARRLLTYDTYREILDRALERLQS